MTVDNPEPSAPTTGQTVTGSENTAVAAPHGTATVNVWNSPPTLDPALAMRDDVALALAAVDRSRSLYSSIDDELWQHVFASLRSLRDVLGDTAARLRTRGPRDVRAVLRFMSRAISAYLERYESGYTQYMSAQGGWEPGWALLERDWLLATNGAPATDLIQMRRAVDGCVAQLNAYVDDGGAIEWREPWAGEYWARWASEQRVSSPAEDRLPAQAPSSVADPSNRRFQLTSPAARTLLRALASELPTQDDIFACARASGTPLARARLSGTSDNAWQSLIEIAHESKNPDQLVHLLDAASDRSEIVKSAVDSYRSGDQK